MMRVRTLRYVVMLLPAALLSSCGEASQTTENNNEKDTDNETTTDMDTAQTETGVDSGTDSSISKYIRNPICRSINDFSQTCDMGLTELLFIQAICLKLDEIFIADFMAHFSACLESKGCERLEAAENLDDDTTRLLEACIVEASLNTVPEQPNTDFISHFCQYYLQCDETVQDASGCDDIMSVALSTYAKALGAPYITDADACVFPMPSCDDDSVEACLDGVIESVTRQLRVDDSDETTATSDTESD